MSAGTYHLEVSDPQGKPIPDVEVQYQYNSGPCYQWPDPRYYWGCTSGPGTGQLVGYTDPSGTLDIDLPYNAPGANVTGTLKANGYYSRAFTHEFGQITGDVWEDPPFVMTPSSGPGGGPPPQGQGFFASFWNWWNTTASTAGGHTMLYAAIFIVVLIVVAAIIIAVVA